MKLTRPFSFHPQYRWLLDCTYFWAPPSSYPWHFSIVWLDNWMIHFPIWLIRIASSHRLGPEQRWIPVQYVLCSLFHPVRGHTDRAIRPCWLAGCQEKQCHFISKQFRTPPSIYLRVFPNITFRFTCFVLNSGYSFFYISDQNKHTYKDGKECRRTSFQYGHLSQ